MAGSHPAVDLEQLLAHSEWVRALARRLVRDEATADDVVQQTWLAALRSPPREIASPRAWLSTVVTNFARRSHRTRARRAGYEQDALPRRGDGPPDEVVAKAELHGRVVRAVTSLDEPYRTTLLLRFFEGLEPAEVAARTGVPAETVRTRTRRALERLRARLAADLGGDGRDWRLVLMPLVGPPDAPAGAGAGAGSAGLTTGALILAMTTKNAAAVLVALALVAGGLAWRTAGSTVRNAAPGDGGEERAAAAVTHEEDATRPQERRSIASDATRGGSERTMDTGAARTAPSPLHLTVRDGSGAAIPGAQVVAFGPDGVAASSTTGPDGRTELFGAHGAAGLVVVAPGRPLLVRDGAPVDGGMIVVAQGVEIKGLVRVDGAEPPEPLRLRVTSDAPFLMPGRLPDAVWDALRESGFSPHETSVDVDPRGGFRFAGLPDGVDVRVVIPRGYELAPDGGRTQDVRTPARDVLVDALRLPRLTGRVVDPATGAPVPGAFVVVTFRRESGNGSIAASADAEGRFAVALAFGEYESLHVEVGTTASGLSRFVAVDGLPRTGRDLGDLALGALRDVRLHVVDENGEPIAGAVAKSEDNADPASAPTGAEGTTVVRLPDSLAGTRVAALGYGAVAVDLPVGVAQPVVVTLPAGTLLRVRLLGAAAEFSVRVAADAPIFSGPGIVPSPEPAHVAAGMTQIASGAWSETRSVAWFHPPEDGVVVLAGLLPDVDLDLAAFDAYGHRHAGAKVRLAPGERREMVLRADGEPRELLGTVRDRDGRPVVHARVTVLSATADATDDTPDMDSGVTQWTDQEGRFAFEGVYAPNLCALVQADGLVPFNSRTVRTTAGAFDVTLDRGRSVRVSLTVPEGTDWDEVWIHAESHRADLWDAGVRLWTGEPVAGAPGRFDLTELPLEEMDLVVEVGDATHRFPLDTGAVEAQFEIPAE